MRKTMARTSLPTSKFLYDTKWHLGRLSERHYTQPWSSLLWDPGRKGACPTHRGASSLTALPILLFSQLMKFSPTEIARRLLLLLLSHIIGLASHSSTGALERTLDHTPPNLQKSRQLAWVLPGWLTAFLKYVGWMPRKIFIKETL